MVSALDSGSGGLGSSLGRGTVLCSWARHFTLIVRPLFIQVYTVNSLLTDTSIRWTPPSDGHLVVVLAVFHTFYCN